MGKGEGGRLEFRLIQSGAEAGETTISTQSWILLCTLEYV